MTHQTKFKKKNINKHLLIISFLFVPMLLLMVFTYYPAFKLVELSFSNWDGISPNYDYVGMSNYLDAVKDNGIVIAFKNTIAYVIMGLVQVLMGLILAIILDAKVRGRNFFRAVNFLPYVLNGVAVAFMFNYLYDFENGPINVILRGIGLGEYAIRWIGSSYFSNFSLALIHAWIYTGFHMIIFLGGLQSISQELYEAATVDGATFFKKINYITMPSIKRVVELNLILTMTGAFQAWFEPFVLTRGGPGDMTHTFVTKTLDVAFKYRNFGKASAMGIMLMLLIALITLMQKKLLGQEEEN